MGCRRLKTRLHRFKLSWQHLLLWVLLHCFFCRHPYIRYQNRVSNFQPAYATGAIQWLHVELSPDWFLFLLHFNVFLFCGIIPPLSSVGGCSILYLDTCFRYIQRFLICFMSTPMHLVLPFGVAATPYVLGRPKNVSSSLPTSITHSSPLHNAGVTTRTRLPTQN